MLILLNFVQYKYVKTLFKVFSPKERNVLKLFCVVLYTNQLSHMHHFKDETCYVDLNRVYMFHSIRIIFRTYIDRRTGGQTNRMNNWARLSQVYAQDLVYIRSPILNRLKN